MRREQFEKMLGRATSEERLRAMLRMQQRRTDRRAARKAKVALNQYRRTQFKSSVERAFDTVKTRVTVDHLTVRE